MRQNQAMEVPCSLAFSVRCLALARMSLNSDVLAVWNPAELREMVICESRRIPSCLPNAAIRSFLDMAKSLDPSSLDSCSMALDNKSNLKWNSDKA